MARAGTTIASALAALLIPLPAGAQSQVLEPPGLARTVRDFVGAQVMHRPLGFDPRPIVADADLVSGIDSTDLVHDAAVTPVRMREAYAFGIPAGDLLADARCLFTETGMPPPWRVLSPAAAERERLCSARGPFATFAMSSVPVDTNGERVGPVHVVVVLPSGYRVWELILEAVTGGGWRVTHAMSVFSIAS